MKTPQSWIEVIEVRSPQGAADAVETLLQDLVTENCHTCVDVFRRVTLHGDFLLHLHHATGPVNPNGSDLGLRVASALRNRGLVNHTVWHGESAGATVS